MWTDLSSVFSQCTRVTDRRTDRQTDGRTERILIAIPRLHYIQRGKNRALINCAAAMLSKAGIVIGGVYVCVCVGPLRN